MTTIENLIRRLLIDQKIDDFSENLIFRDQILNKNEAAEILVNIMYNESNGITARAREMLCLFDKNVFDIIAHGLSLRGSIWRAELLNILWIIISSYDLHNQKVLLSKIFPQIIPVLDDRDIFSLDYPKMPEKEYQYRVCDETFLFIMGVLKPDYDETLFLGMEEEERNTEIRILKSRINSLFA